MNKWQQLARFILEAARDVAGLGLGALLVVRAAFFPVQTLGMFYALLGGGLTLIAPAIAAHAKALLPASDPGSFLGSEAEHSPPPSLPSSSTEAQGEPES